ncbi:MAG: DUF1893 domain-containing protein [Ruminococcus sp.]|nr:DUF1893 domain-containing protein [Ruminococcus sp.]
MYSLNNDLINAKKIFETGKYTCVICKDDVIMTSICKGVKPLVEWLESGTNFKDFSAIDKIIGKAAAHLYILMRVDSVHASVMSKGAFELLSENNIKASYDTLIDVIINRKGDDICPMEKAVAGINDSIVAFSKIKETISILQKIH